MSIKAVMLAGAITAGLGAASSFAQPAPDDATDTQLAAASKPAFDASATGEIEAEYYTVRKGDSLSRIARRFYGNSVLWQPILNANADMIKQGGRLIFPGTRLTIPALDAAGPEIATVTAQAGTPTLSIVTGNDYAPFTDKELPEGGLFTDLVRTAMVRAG